MFLLALLVGLVACSPLISPFTEQAYQNATSLKARSLVIVSKAGESYSVHRTVVEQLLVDVDAAYEYAKGLPKNTVVTEQWDTLRDPSRNLLGGFAKRWEQFGTINEFTRNEIAIQLGSAFDTIICVEVNKKEDVTCNN